MKTLSYNYKKVKILKKNIKSKVLWMINRFRYSFPGPTKVATVDTLNHDDIQILWKGAPPKSQTFDDCSPKNFLDIESLVFKQPFVVNIKNGRVYGERGFVMTNDGYLLTDINPEMSQHRKKHSLTQRGNMPDPVRIKGTVAVLNSAGYNNFFHFLLDTLGRLRYFNKVDVDIDYYYTLSNTKFQKELLKIFKIPDEKIITADYKTHIEADNLLATSLPGDNTMSETRYKPFKDFETCQFIRNTILQISEATQIRTDSKLVYIQRRGSRSLDNEPELLEALQTFGKWNIVSLEDHTILEQANIFYNADVIVAMHGAGLANIIYCKPNTSVVEIINPAYASPLYYQIANLFQLKYFPFIGNTKEGLISKKNNIKGNVHVDVQPIVSQIRDVIDFYMLNNVTDI